MTFTPSKYQLAIFEHVSDMFYGDAPSLGVDAKAGSGKTTTAVMATKQIPPHVKARFMAFNKSIAVELGKRLPENFQASTFHSFGFQAILKQGNKVKVEQDKSATIFAELVTPPPKYADPEDKTYYYEFRSQFIKALSWAKNLMVDRNDVEALNSMVFNELDLEGFEGSVAPLLQIGLQRAVELGDKIIDFDDMIWLPLILGMNLEKYDFLVVDESQDLNLAQIELIKKSLKYPNGKVLVIGDPKQSIYQWRGADEMAMQRLMTAFRCDSLPLSITYRCPKSVVRLANTLVPELEAREDAPEGLVDHKSEDFMLNSAKPKDMILCRVNAPLAEYAFSFIRKGIKASIQGRDIGKNLSATARKAADRSVTMQDVYESLYSMRQAETGKIANNPYIKSMDRKIEKVNDKYDTLMAIAANSQSPADFPVQCQNLFSDYAEGIVLSTVHRAKGLEAENVYIIRPDLMPHPLAKTPSALEQERNLQYVAWTRAKNSLYFVD